jgi:hypothetical protein
MMLIVVIVVIAIIAAFMGAPLWVALALGVIAAGVAATAPPKYARH